MLFWPALLFDKITGVNMFFYLVIILVVACDIIGNEKFEYYLLIVSMRWDGTDGVFRIPTLLSRKAVFPLLTLASQVAKVVSYRIRSSWLLGHRSYHSQ